MRQRRWSDEYATGSYRIWVDEGQPEGQYLDHWLRAKAAVKEEDALINGTEELKQDRP